MSCEHLLLRTNRYLCNFRLLKLDPQRNSTSFREKERRYALLLSQYDTLFLPRVEFWKVGWIFPKVRLKKKKSFGAFTNLYYFQNFADLSPTPFDQKRYFISAPTRIKMRIIRGNSTSTVQNQNRTQNPVTTITTAIKGNERTGPDQERDQLMNQTQNTREQTRYRFLGNYWSFNENYYKKVATFFSLLNNFEFLDPPRKIVPSTWLSTWTSRIRSRLTDIPPFIRPVWYCGRRSIPKPGRNIHRSKPWFEMC